MVLTISYDVKTTLFYQTPAKNKQVPPLSEIIVF